MRLFADNLFESRFIKNYKNFPKSDKRDCFCRLTAEFSHHTLLTNSKETQSRRHLHKLQREKQSKSRKHFFNQTINFQSMRECSYKRKTKKWQCGRPNPTTTTTIKNLFMRCDLEKRSRFLVGFRKWVNLTFLVEPAPKNAL